jgi:hypothetical protein
LGVALIASSAILFLVAFETGFLPFEGASLVSFVLGIALLVVDLEPRVRLSVASDAMLGYLRALDGALKVLRVTGKATYLLHGNQVSMIMTQEGLNLPLELPPVGLGIHEEITKELGDFSEKGLDYFGIWMPRVLVDNLSMSDEVKVSREGDGIKVSMGKPFVRRLCIDPFVNANVCCRMGCPLAGAVAQALAVTTGREVRFENCTYDPKTQRAETMLSLGKSG